MKPWYQILHCKHCNLETRHRGVQAGLWEIYTCLLCRKRKMYKVG